MHYSDQPSITSPQSNASAVPLLITKSNNESQMIVCAHMVVRHSIFTLYPIQHLPHMPWIIYCRLAVVWSSAERNGSSHCIILQSTLLHTSIYLYRREPSRSEKNCNRGLKGGSGRFIATVLCKLAKDKRFCLMFAFFLKVREAHEYWILLLQLQIKLRTIRRLEGILILWGTWWKRSRVDFQWGEKTLCL